MSTNKAVTKSAGIIAIATLASRILGFIRDIAIARFFGTAVFAQAFVVAFRIPNLLRDLIGEGAVNSAFVPVFSGYLAKEKEKREFWRLANTVLNLVAAFLMILILIGMACSPLIVRLIAPGFISQPEKLGVTVALTRYLFPYILLIGLSACFMGILNSLKEFASSAIGPCLLNLAMITSVVIFRDNIIALGTGILIGGILQLLIQIPPLVKRGMHLEKKLSLAHPGAKEIGILLIPRIFGTSIYQLSIFVATILASLSAIVGEGAVAALYYANRIFQFPLAIFGLALAQAALPTMSVQAAENNIGELKKTLEFSLRSVFFITLPAAIGLLILSTPITKVLFERGEFGAYSTAITSSALFYYCFGLLFYAGVRMLVSAFYSLKDTATPVKAAFICLIINILFSLVLMRPLKVGGLALAASVSGIANFFILFFILRRRLGKLNEKMLLLSLGKTVLSSSVMGFCLIVFLPRLDLMLSAASNTQKFIILFLVITFSLIIFMVLSFILRSSEIKSLSRWILRKS